MIQDLITFFRIQMESAMLPFVIPICICIIYWMLMLIGLMDLEMVDSVLGFSDGAADAGAEGATEGAVDGGGEGLEAAGEGLGVLASFLSFLNFGQAPATILITLFSFYMWLFANIVRVFFKTPTTVSTVVLLAIFASIFTSIFIVSCILTHFTGKPFKRLMAICTYHGGVHLIGKVCEVRSRIVTSKHGQAELLLEGSSPLMLHVICDHKNDLKKGNKAVIVDYEKDKDLYIIEPMF